MNFVIRPSKIYLFDVLARMLRGADGAVGLDAASAGFKNRRMFQTKKYFGLDMDLNALRRGISKNTESSYGIYGDIRQLDFLSSDSADVVVSTHTLDHLSFTDRIQACTQLIRVVKPKGVFIFNVSNNESFQHLRDLCNNTFESVEILYYKNPLSRLYENAFERGGDLGSHPIAGTRPMKAIAWLISRFEFLTSHSPGTNSHALVRCRSKKHAGPARQFVVDAPFDPSQRLFFAL